MSFGADYDNISNAEDTASLAHENTVYQESLYFQKALFLMERGKVLVEYIFPCSSADDAFSWCVTWMQHRN